MVSEKSVVFITKSKISRKKIKIKIIPYFIGPAEKDDEFDDLDVILIQKVEKREPL